MGIMSNIAEKAKTTRIVDYITLTVRLMANRRVKRYNQEAISDGKSMSRPLRDVIQG